MDNFIGYGLDFQIPVKDHRPETGMFNGAQDDLSQGNGIDGRLEFPFFDSLFNDIKKPPGIDPDIVLGFKKPGKNSDTNSPV